MTFWCFDAKIYQHMSFKRPDMNANRLCFVLFVCFFCLFVFVFVFLIFFDFFFLFFCFCFLFFVLLVINLRKISFWRGRVLPCCKSAC